jgi:kumamolisin
MRRCLVLLTVAAVALFLGFTTLAPMAHAQEHNKVIVPESNFSLPGYAHTNFVYIIHDPSTDPSNPCGPTCETPASLACVYDVVVQISGCPIATATNLPTGGIGAIALVDAYDNPDAVTDINTYAAQFGLPTPNFSQVYATGKKPMNNPGGWSLEEALDIEMAVATAPAAKIYLVEAASNSFADLYFAESVASGLVVAAGGGVVSNSWSGGEYTGQQNDEKTYFSTPTVTYFASTGDAGINNVGVPSTFATVVAAGGTHITRVSGNFTSESWWTGGGGGSSAIEKRPSYQNGIETIVGNFRGVPDISADADPNTGPAMYDLDGGYGWFQVGGTSVSSPYLAGTVSAAGKIMATSLATHSLFYKEYANATKYKADWNDITTGGSECKVGWDFCTGIGSPHTYAGK